MFRDENEKHRLNFSRSSEKNLSQFSRDLARTRILADLCCEVREIGEEGLRRRTGNDSKQKRGICSEAAEAAPQLNSTDLHHLLPLLPPSSSLNQTMGSIAGQVVFARATLFRRARSFLSMPYTVQNSSPPGHFHY